ncbi:hypothetical protein D3C81_1497200 [compost metagenome]
MEAGDQWWSEIFHEAIAGAQGEGARQLIEVQCLGGAQDGFGILHQRADPFTQFQCPGRGNQSAPGPHQQRIARGFAQPRQRPAHGRRAQAQTLRGAGHAAFFEQHVQGDQQIQVWHRINSCGSEPCGEGACRNAAPPRLSA